MSRHYAMRIALTIVVVLTVLLPAFLSSPARAAESGFDISFGGSVQLEDETGIYLAVSAHYFDQDRNDVRRWHHQCDDPDDLAVALFIARNARTSPDYVFALRETGLNWWQIGLRIGVPVDAWFPAVRRDPGPPYGKAYGHYKQKGPRNPTEMYLDDADTRNLVAVRMLHEYYGITVEAAMDWRENERPLRDITARKYRERHGHGRDMSGVAVGSMAGGAGSDTKAGQKKGHGRK